MFKEKFITVKNNLSIYTESIGDPANPAVFLIIVAMKKYGAHVFFNGIKIFVRKNC
jgi:hypothetical protein